MLVFNHEKKELYLSLNSSRGNIFHEVSNQTTSSKVIALLYREVSLSLLHQEVVSFDDK